MKPHRADDLQALRFTINRDVEQLERALRVRTSSSSGVHAARGAIRMRFRGLGTLPANEAIIELRVGDLLLDLHNCASFAGFEYQSSGTLSVRFRFDVEECDGKNPIGTEYGSDLELRFEGVEGFQATRDEGPYEAETLDYLLYRDARGELEILFMDGLRLSFKAQTIRAQLIHEAEAASP